MRFVCAGDLHLGSGADLSPDGADGRLAEMEAVLAQIVDAANELDAPLLWVGDAWEHRRPSPSEVIVVRRQFARLEQRALIIPGNHDVEAFGRPTGYDLLATAPIVVTTPGVVGGDGYQIACLPWAQASRLVDLEDDRDRVHERLAEGLLDIARGLYTSMEVDGPQILVGHWSISGASTPSGIPTDQFREPVIPLAELEAIGFDAIVFGHIHKPQILSMSDSPPVFYVGSPLALNFGETGSDHGAWLLDFSSTGDAEAYMIALDSPRLVTIDAEFVEEFVAYPVDEVAGCVVKLRIRATEEEARRLDLAGEREALFARGARQVWSIEVITQRAEPVRGAAVDEGLDDRELFDRWLDAVASYHHVQPAELLDRFNARLRDRHAAYLEATL